LIKSDKPYCDECGKELRTLSEDECLDDIMSHGWTKWRSAIKHYCYDCSDKIEEKIGYPPCDECETQPCERGRDCWASPPLHIFPYETYYAELKPPRKHKDDSAIDQFITNKTKRVVFRIRKRYFDAIVDGSKRVEYRKDSVFWFRRFVLRPPPDIAVFICGKRVHRRRITRIEAVITPGGFSEQGKKDVSTPLCYAIHLGEAWKSE
jgi:hypothetical protein